MALGGSAWTLTDRLLAAAIDVLATANWQRQGKKGAQRPKPISPLAEAGPRPTGPAAGRTQQDVDGLLTAMRTGAYGEG